MPLKVLGLQQVMRVISHSLLVCIKKEIQNDELTEE